MLLRARPDQHSGRDTGQAPWRHQRLVARRWRSGDLRRPLGCTRTTDEGFGFILDFNNGTGWTNNGNGSFIPGLYASLIGLLLAQYTITGFDASAHVSEETTDAGRSASVAIVRAIYVSAIAALVLNIAMLQATPKGGFRRHHRRGRRVPGPRRCQRPGGAGRRRRGQAADRHLCCGPVLLRHGVGHGQLPDDLRLLPGRRHPGPQVLAPDQPEDPDADELNLAGLRTLARRRGAVAVPGQRLLGGVLRHDRHVRGRALHRLRHPDLPAPAQPGLRPGRLEPRQVQKLVGWTSVVWVAFISILFFAPPFWPFWPITGGRRLRWTGPSPCST